ncbi:hypothetical protein Despr_1230 [Desulfobulbus propionicus DSM 2032]|uniref:Uncharacterized protein n=1 Tax=Desulfobulbus propionicus (strain ATCC 33891 / DSM 2032 / VKM B-1956 / 1pr3) TaxID=577650 RepID=A0A7U3YL67_DESPD|nr:hypothetical protein Despr_1230 [Desulfobulbus propionicus DSM 2032]
MVTQVPSLAGFLLLRRRMRTILPDPLNGTRGRQGIGISGPQ